MVDGTISAPPRRSGRCRYVLGSLAALGLGAVTVLAGVFGPVRSEPDRPAPAAPAAIAAGTALPPAGAPPEQVIEALQARLDAVPGDHVAWANLGLAYVQQAATTVDPSFYAKAEGALRESLDLEDDENHLARAGLSALAAAAHDFAEARDWAEEGLAINPYSALLYGVLSDAQIQLGQYDAAFESVQRMVDLAPGTASLARVSYTWELRGELDTAVRYMERALESAVTPADRAYASALLAELALASGDAAGALAHAEAGLADQPDHVPSLANLARALAAQGRTDEALRRYDQLVTAVPDPVYVLEHGELLESVGRHDEAGEQYELFETILTLLRAEGGGADVTPTLYLADHGDPAEALAAAEAGLEDRPFVAMWDAYAWALHANGRYQEAAAAIENALVLGTPEALFHYHAGTIHASLGNTDRAAEELGRALALDPAFHPLWAPDARSMLADLDSA